MRTFSLHKKLLSQYIAVFLTGMLLLPSVRIFANDSDVVNCGKSWRIVVLGSSTAFGTGASTTDSSWVSRYRRYVKSKNVNSQVFNLGIPGYRTYQNLRPDGYVPPINRPTPASGFNITAALALTPDAIIINMPSNDAASNYTVDEQKANFEESFRIADSAQIPIWVTTTQPRSNMSVDQMQNLRDMRQWIIDRFGSKSVNFWDGIANPDGTIASFYFFDNVHVNNRGHEEFFNRMKKECLLDSLCRRYQGILTVNAGENQNIQFPSSQFDLQGSALSSKAIIGTKQWYQISGPTQCQFSNPDSLITVVSGFIPGIYQFVLSVNDNRFNFVNDTVQISVICPPSSTPQITDSITLCSSQLPINWNGHLIQTEGYHQKTMFSQYGCDSAIAVYITIQSCVLTIDLKLFIEGYLTANNQMRTKLFDLGISSDSSAVDSVAINLWKPSNVNDNQPDYSQIGILNKNGLVSVDFPGDISGRHFYISVKHQNSMEIWSSDSIQITNLTYHDFTENINNTFSNGSNLPQKNIQNNVFGMYSGDVNQDGSIDIFDIQKIENDATSFNFGNQISDCNGDGVVDLVDMQLVENNSGLFIFLSKPQ
jgi:lysophospholipase L1-like esterase